MLCYYALKFLKGRVRNWVFLGDQSHILLVKTPPRRHGYGGTPTLVDLYCDPIVNPPAILNKEQDPPLSSFLSPVQQPRLTVNSVLQQQPSGLRHGRPGSPSPERRRRTVCGTALEVPHQRQVRNKCRYDSRRTNWNYPV